MKKILSSLIFLVALCINISALAQVQGNTTVEEFVELINGKDDPLLISESQLFSQLSRLLISSGPSNCINDIENIRGFSRVAPCMVLEGVDPMEAELFALDHIKYSEETDLIEVQDLCNMKSSIDLTELTTEDFNIRQQAIQTNMDNKRAEYFKNKGIELLGSESMSILLEWANENMRPNMSFSKIDMVGLMVSKGGTIDQYLTMMCRSLDQI